MVDVTQILGQIESGDSSAAEALLPLVYDELRKLAAAKLRHEQPGVTLQATALVHEAYLNLVRPSQNPSHVSKEGPQSDGASGIHWNSRGHFFAAAAEAMRRILIMNARRRRAEKRGGGKNRVEFDERLQPQKERDERLLDLADALDRLELVHPEKAQVVKLRYFVGFTIAETASVMGISDATADRYWTFAKTWLQRDMVTQGFEKPPCTQELVFANLLYRRGDFDRAVDAYERAIELNPKSALAHTLVYF